MTEHSLRADMGSGESWDDPSADLLYELLADIERGDEERMTVSLLSHQSTETLTVATHKDGVWSLERRDAASARTYYVSLPDLRDTHEALTAWAFRFEGWEQVVPWRDDATAHGPTELFPAGIVRELAAPALLSIGIVTGGLSPRSNETSEGLGLFGQLVIREREGFANEGLRLNIVFHVPGPLSVPEYKGAHATRLDRKTAHLLMVAAVPGDLNKARIPGYLIEVLGVARLEANDYPAKRKFPVDAGNLVSFIDYLIAKLADREGLNLGD